MTDRLLKLFTILWGLDTLFTTIFVNTAGLETEANPIMRYAMDHLGLVGFAIVKMLVLAGFAFMMIRNPHRRFTNITLVALNAIMLYVVTIGALLAHFVTTNPIL